MAGKFDAYSAFDVTSTPQCDVPEADHERVEPRKGGYCGVLGLGANDREPSRRLSPMVSILSANTPRARPIVGDRASVSPRLELLKEFDHGLLVFRAQLAEPPNDLARVTPIGLRLSLIHI